jgi:hypothetical protein
MGFVMDLVAGDTEVILATLAKGDFARFDAPPFSGHLSLGGTLDPTWLDLFSQAAREVTQSGEPRDFLDARTDIEAGEAALDRTVEQIDAQWIAAIAQIPDAQIDAVAGGWIDLVHAELGELAREEKPWIRTLAGEIVEFARKADRSPAVILAWSLS